jgi:D-alanine--poly(phosphoribitol) ligase subunit 2
MGVAPDLHDRITRIFSGSLNLDIPAIDTDLFESGVLDSLAFVELLLQLEREFGVSTSVDDLDVDNFRTIARIAEFVGSRAAAELALASHIRVVQRSSRR